MAVQVNRRFNGRLQGFDQIIGIIGRQQAGHVFDADAVGPHTLEILGLIDIIVNIVDLSAHTRLGHRVAHTTLEVLAVLFYHRNDRFKVTVVVKGIKCAKDVHPVFTGPFDKGLGDIIGVIAISDQVLGPQQHRKRRLFNIAL